MIMPKNITGHIRKHIDLSQSELAIFNKYVEIYQFKKKEFILQESKVCKHLYFVEKGCLRMYFINKKGIDPGFQVMESSGFKTKTQPKSTG